MLESSTVHAEGTWIDTLGRIGFAAKAVVYMIIGSVCLRGVSNTGSKDALVEIGQQPFGRVLLAIVGAGLMAYALWRFATGIFDHGKEGDDPVSIGKRIGYVASGLIYTGLAVIAGQLILGSVGSGGGAHSWTATLLSAPLGRVLVALVAVGTLLGGLNQLKHAIDAGFADAFRRAHMSRRELAFAIIIGRIGHVARFVIYSIIGWFLGRAAWLANANEVKGFSEALETVREQAYGPWLLAATGFGFVCYSAMCAVMARYRY